MMCTEFLPYLKFIGCNNAENKRAFKQEFMSENSENPKFFIKSIFEKLTEDMEKKALVKIEKADDDTGAKLEVHLKRALVQIHIEKMTQLRMVLSHPYNVENLLRTMASDVDIQRLRHALVDIGKKRPVMEQLFENAELVSELKPYSSGVEMMKKCSEGTLGGQVDLEVCLNMMQIGREAKASNCAVCGKTPELPVKATNCGHFYCDNCYLNEIENPTVDQSGATLVNHSQSIEREIRKALQDTKFVEPGIDFNHVSLQRPDERNGCFILGQYKKDVAHIPSSRLTVAMCVLGSWVIDHPQDKIMVFTQFIATAKVLGLMLQKAKIPFLYYYGCMSAANKTRALKTFRAENISSGPKVLLVSLKAGGQSLNLACANRIIIIDPWWNVTAEQQAIGRAHRIKQEKECHVVRVWTDSDTDTKIMGLQKVKSEEIDYALQDDGHMPLLLDDEERGELYNFATSEKNGNEEDTAARLPRQGRKRLRRQEADSDKANDGSRRKHRKRF
ncbi:hypothetical protein E4U21_006769 [Claviceps maximensis]|nr:hypothetical protein E4U21_006769 [Claviceps maximensis]